MRLGQVQTLGFAGSGLEAVQGPDCGFAESGPVAVRGSIWVHVWLLVGPCGSM